MSLKSILIKLLPFLYSAAEKLWEKTPREQQEQAITTVAFTQSIKDYLTTTAPTVRNIIIANTKLPADVVDASLSALGTVNQLSDTSPLAVIEWAQKKASSGLTDLGWNQHWDNIAKALAVIISGNKIDWLSLMLGLVQIALEIFRKK
jgi:hypothetical protein